MIALGEILAYILEPLANILPRATAKPAPTETLVVNDLLFGIQTVNRAVAYIPVTTEVASYSNAPVPLDLAAQSFMTFDGKAVYVNATAIYWITDPIQLHEALGAENYEEYISVRIRNAIRETIQDLTTEEVYTTMIDVGDVNLIEFGIHIEQVAIEDLVFMKTFRIL